MNTYTIRRVFTRAAFLVALSMVAIMGVAQPAAAAETRYGFKCHYKYLMASKIEMCLWATPKLNQYGKWQLLPHAKIVNHEYANDDYYVYNVAVNDMTLEFWDPTGWIQLGPVYEDYDGYDAIVDYADGYSGPLCFGTPTTYRVKAHFYWTNWDTYHGIIYKDSAWHSSAAFTISC